MSEVQTSCSSRKHVTGHGYACPQPPHCSQQACANAWCCSPTHTRAPRQQCTPPQHTQVLSAQDLPLLYAGPHAPSQAISEPAPQLPSPATTTGCGGMAASSLFADAWGEPGYLSAPAAFPSAPSHAPDAGPPAPRVHPHLQLHSSPPPALPQHLPTAAALAAAAPPPSAPPAGSLGCASLTLPQAHTLHPGSLDLGSAAAASPLLAPTASQPSSASSNSSSNTAFLVHQLQQLRLQQQQKEQRQQLQLQVKQQQQQLGSNLLVQTNQLSAEQQAALSSGQPWQMNSNAQVSRLLSSIQNNSNRCVLRAPSWGSACQLAFLSSTDFCTYLLPTACTEPTLLLGRMHGAILPRLGWILGRRPIYHASE